MHTPICFTDTTQNIFIRRINRWKVRVNGRVNKLSKEIAWKWVGKNFSVGERRMCGGGRQGENNREREWIGEWLSDSGTEMICKLNIAWLIEGLRDYVSRLQKNRRDSCDSVRKSELKTGSHSGIKKCRIIQWCHNALSVVWFQVF
jgi:hypothetical protein